MDYRTTFYQFVTSAVTSNNQMLARVTKGSDDEAVQKAVITWLTARQKEQKELYDAAKKIYDTEFGHRQKQLQEEAFFRDMEKQQKEVDKMWTEH